jgi:hypothetical protein
MAIIAACVGSVVLPGAVYRILRLSDAGRHELPHRRESPAANDAAGYVTVCNVFCHLPDCKVIVVFKSFIRVDAAGTQAVGGHAPDTVYIRGDVCTLSVSSDDSGRNVFFVRPAYCRSMSTDEVQRMAALRIEQMYRVR